MTHPTTYPTTHPTDRAVVLVARPTPAGLDERALRRLAGAVAGRVPDSVHVAHLDHEAPSLHEVLDELAAAGTASVLVLALAVPADRYLTSWIAKAVANWRESRESILEIRQADGLTDLPGVADAVADLVSSGGRPVTASPAGFRSPAWSDLDIPDRHLLVCRGPRCTAHGAGATHRALADASRGTGTQVTGMSCIGPCNLGPLVIEHSTGQWHQHVDTERAEALAADRP